VELRSEEFEDGGELAQGAAHGYVGGDNVSPHLAWSGEPSGTASFALTCWDPDAPTGVGFAHWVRFDIPPDTHELPPGAGTENGPGVDGFTDWGESQYGGMAPPAGDPAHHYVFTVYALDTPSLGLGPTTTYAMFRFMTREHVLDSASLTGLFAV
jgi:Raf kinase inhibitor-like YbhB/YbcL family protein